MEDFNIILGTIALIVFMYYINKWTSTKSLLGSPLQDFKDTISIFSSGKEYDKHWYTHNDRIYNNKHPDPRYWSPIKKREYFKTSKCKKLKATLLQLRGSNCECCGLKKSSLDLHHITYERFGNEKLSDVALLCRHCHELTHLINQPFSNIIDYWQLYPFHAVKEDWEKISKHYKATGEVRNFHKESFDLICSVFSKHQK